MLPFPVFEEERVRLEPFDGAFPAKQAHMVADIRKSILHRTVRCGGSANGIFEELSVRGEIHRPPYVSFFQYACSARLESSEEFGSISIVFGKSDEFFHVQ